MKRARSEGDKDRRRQEILEAALQAFYARGMTATRMEDVARAAGLSKGALYLYFRSKEALFEALIETVAKPNLARVEAVIRSAPSAKAALEGLAALAPRVIRDTDAPKLLKIMVGDAVEFPDLLRSYRQEVVDRMLNALAGMLAAARDRGELSVRDPALTARLIVGPILMAALWRILFERPEGGGAQGERLDLEAYFAEHVRLLLRALAPEETTP